MVSVFGCSLNWGHWLPLGDIAARFGGPALEHSPQRPIQVCFSEERVKPLLVKFCALGFMSLVVGTMSCGCGSQPTTGKTVLRGEPEMEELISAMEETVAAKGKGKDKLMAAIQRVIA